MKSTTKILFLMICIISILSSCKKDEVDNLIKENSIIISSIAGTKGGSCTSGADSYTIDIAFQNPKSETVEEIEVDYIYPAGDASFSYDYTNYLNMGATLRWTLCKTFNQSPIKVRVFVVTTGGKRSAPKTFTLITQ